MANNVKQPLKDALEARVCTVENVKTLDPVSTALVPPTTLASDVNMSLTHARQVFAKTALLAPTPVKATPASVLRDSRERTVTKTSSIVRRTLAHHRRHALTFLVDSTVNVHSTLLVMTAEKVSL